MSRVYLLGATKPLWDSETSTWYILVDGQPKQVFVDTEHALCPAAAWPFSEGAGTVAHDIVGSAHSTINGASHITDGLSFDGTDYVVAGDVIPTPNSLTITARIKTSGNYATYNKLVCKRLGYPTSITKYDLMLVSGNGRVGFYTGTLYTTTTTPTTGQWSRITATFSGGALKLYLNDNLIGNWSGVSLGGQDDGWLSFGAYAGSSGSSVQWKEFYYGDMSDVQIYSKALSAAEVASLNTAPWQFTYYEAEDAPTVNIPAIIRAQAPIIGAPFGGNWI
jgi:hypothetical protein